MKTPPQLSIVVPALNEAASIVAALQALQAMRSRGTELILVDGGSTDGTPELARPWTDQVLVAPRGRARQMNAGAAVAQGRVLLFLHADTRLPDGAEQWVTAAISNVLAGRLWGRFDVAIEGRSPWLGLVACMMNWRSRLTGIATGDQAIFVAHSVFRAVGGFPDIPLMEDIALSKALKRLGRPDCLAVRVTTSGRRWERHGVWRTILLMWWLRLRYFLGADPARLALEYGYVPERS